MPMTEESFQQARVIMKKANYWRSKMREADENVRKWKDVEAVFLKTKNILNIEAAKVNVAKFEERLMNATAEFSVLQLPS